MQYFVSIKTNFIKQTPFYSSCKAVWWLPKLIVITCEKMFISRN